MRRGLVLVAVIAIVLTNGLAWGQGSESHSGGIDHLFHAGPHPDTMADVVLVLNPHQQFPLNVPTPGEQVVHGSVLRLERGAMPQRIVNTPNTIIAPLHPGVPMKLYLKAFKDRNVHYIIGIFPLSEGDKP